MLHLIKELFVKWRDCAWSSPGDQRGSLACRACGGSLLLLHERLLNLLICSGCRLFRLLYRLPCGWLSLHGLLLDIADSLLVHDHRLFVRSADYL